MNFRENLGRAALETSEKEMDRSGLDRAIVRASRGFQGLRAQEFVRSCNLSTTKSVAPAVMVNFRPEQSRCMSFTKTAWHGMAFDLAFATISLHWSGGDRRTHTALMEKQKEEQKQRKKKKDTIAWSYFLYSPSLGFFRCSGPFRVRQEGVFLTFTNGTQHHTLVSIPWSLTSKKRKMKHSAWGTRKKEMTLRIVITSTSIYGHSNPRPESNNLIR